MFSFVMYIYVIPVIYMNISYILTLKVAISDEFPEFTIYSNSNTQVTANKIFSSRSHTEN